MRLKSSAKLKRISFCSVIDSIAHFNCSFVLLFIACLKSRLPRTFDCYSLGKWVTQYFYRKNNELERIEADIFQPVHFKTILERFISHMRMTFSFLLGKHHSRSIYPILKQFRSWWVKAVFINQANIHTLLWVTFLCNLTL